MLSWERVRNSQSVQIILLFLDYSRALHITQVLQLCPVEHTLVLQKRWMQTITYDIIGPTVNII